MSKRVIATRKPEITLDQNASAPLYKQLYERLRAAILEGQLEAGARLPSTRTLASEMGISRNTTALAYEQLLLEGYIESKVGDGTRVARLQPEQLLQISKGTKKSHTTRQPTPRPTVLGRRGQLLANLSWPDDYRDTRANAEKTTFSIGQPDVTYFPYDIWAKLIARHARQSLPNVSLYQDAQGYAPLREAIAAHIGITRGVHCSPRQIILTAGAQGAIDLAARVLLDPGDQVWVEDPGYQGARGALLASGAQLIKVPVDQEGIKVEAGQRLCPEARLAVVTPSHQFPTGVTMSLSRRLALLEWCRQAQAWLLEDDYDSEFRFSGRPLEALQGLDNSGHVIYVGTFSKVLFPSLRLGYLVVPPALLAGMVATRRLIDMHLPLLEQLALTDFIVEGHFARHLRKMRLLYLERRNTLVDALKQRLGDMLDVVVPEAGMHLVAWLPTGMDIGNVVQQAARHGLPITPVAQSSQEPAPRQGLVLGFASATPEELQADVKILARTLRELHA
ncbi:MocR-like pyridoxine biosynthesis transcription factor PdxR [Dictyobacter kobayashii]|uniref:GntR family transcriptional regulator n=1 Tax=Dictyobacter kobayashii TaxID=2014872 RepID=A0A402AYS4_9CHLR|nr:PLP-dependent aminotransferase family protein [Dictyobacter kobayashii]GCE24254.1 GntR family transcriptional regulator [Dictyobacter kobayashii]